MGIHEGFIMSEVGEIPKSWNLSNLGECCELIIDGTHFTPDYKDYGVPFYSVENVTNNEFNNVKYISIGEHERLSKRCKPQLNDILMTRIGSLGETIIINWDHESSIYVSLALLRIKSGILPQYIYVYSKSYQFLSDIKRRSLLNAYPQKINLGEINHIPIPLPPLPEQRAIAEVLSDMDALIQAQEALIEKKKLIKQGVMQELLTGKRRLPGFGNLWETKKLIDIGNIFAGGTPSTFRPDFWGGDIKWLPSGKIQNNRVDFLDTDNTITKLGLDNSSARLIKPKSVLLAITGATCGNVGYIKFETSANQSVIAIEPNNYVDYKFLFYLLQHYRNYILSFQNGSAQGGLNLKIVQELTFKFPSKEEQISISAIINSIDDEISCLNAQLEKIVSTKQGMMQELLTGKTRLV